MTAIRFGPFELDPITGELRRDGAVIPLAPQPFRLLHALASRPGELVTREELCRKVWGEGTFVDFERGLNFAVLQVRTALGDNAKNPLYVETLPKRGYRFVGRIDPSPGASRHPLPAQRGEGYRVKAAIAAAALLAITIVAASQWRSGPPPAQRPMIAVLPFDDLSAARDSYFTDGITEELITHLGRIHPRRLGVISRTSVLRYDGTTKSIRDIGRELGARYVVEGSVRREGERVRVTVQLIDAHDQTHLWADSFDRAGSGALAIQEDVAARIARALRIEIFDETALAAHSAAAHEAYLRGRHLWHENKDDDALRELREAIRLEPGFALAHIALAETVHSLAMRERIRPADAAAEIRRSSDAALRLAPSLAQSHGITAMLHFWYEWNWQAADESYRRAIELNPGEPGALHDHGWLLITRGALDEGIAEIRRAQELDPVSPRANAHVAWAYIYSRRYADAIREAERALALSPQFHEASFCLEHAHELSGNFAAALAVRETRTGKKIETRDPRAYYVAERLRLAEEAERNPRDVYQVAAALAMAGHRERALRWLRRAKEERNLTFVLAGADPKLASLHGEAAFAALLKDAGLQVIRPRTR